MYMYTFKLQNAPAQFPVNSLCFIPSQTLGKLNIIVNGNINGVRGIVNAVTKDELQAIAGTKVDKVTGLGLSSRNFTVQLNQKLAGIQTGATRNSPDSFLLSRTNHTGFQSISSISNLQTTLDNKVTKDGTKVLTTNNFDLAYLNKLNGIATGATKNATDAFLRARANQTGTQAISTINGLEVSLNTKSYLYFASFGSTTPDAQGVYPYIPGSIVIDKAGAKVTVMNETSKSGLVMTGVVIQRV